VAVVETWSFVTSYLRSRLACDEDWSLDATAGTVLLSLEMGSSVVATAEARGLAD
jgi:hypothetical protein